MLWLDLDVSNYISIQCVVKLLYPLGGPTRSQFPVFLFPLRYRVLFHAVNDVSWEAVALRWHAGDPAASCQYPIALPIPLEPDITTHSHSKTCWRAPSLCSEHLEPFLWEMFKVSFRFALSEIKACPCCLGSTIKGTCFVPLSFLLPGNGNRVCI